MYSLTFRMTFPNGVFKDNIFEHFDFCYKDFFNNNERILTILKSSTKVKSIEIYETWNGLDRKLYNTYIDEDVDNYNDLLKELSIDISNIIASIYTQHIFSYQIVNEYKEMDNESSDNFLL